MKNYARGSHSRAAADYAKAVISRKIDACLQVRQACQRFIDDHTRQDIHLDTIEVDAACNFIQALPHVAGPLAGQPIQLEPFQVFIVANLFGWIVKATGLRRFREAFILLPRGSGKSTLAAPIALYMTFCLGEGGAASFCGATSMAQADAVFEPAKRMLEMTPEACAMLGVEVMAKSIFQISSGSSFKPVISKTKDGSIPWCCISDELHQAIDDTQLNAFRTGMGKRRGSDPLLIIISTAGTNVAGVCRQEQLYFEAVLSGTITDDSKFCVVYTIDKDDDWKDFKVWRKANPAYGVSVDEDHLRREYDKALQSPSAQAAALTKYLNVWQNTASGWLNIVDWARAADKSATIDPSWPCYIGVDLSTKTDITAVTVVARRPNGKIVISPYIFLPSGALDRSKNAKAYEEWIASGDIISTDGSASDHQAVEDTIRTLVKELNVTAVLFDAWQAAGMMQRLQADGIECMEFPNNARMMTAPMTDFEADLLNGNIVHPDNAALNWMASNICVKQMGILKRAEKPTGQDHLKIDGMVAALMAYAGLSTVEEAPQVPQLFFL